MTFITIVADLPDPLGEITIQSEPLFMIEKVSHCI
jgi:hypothetical protein